MCSDVNIAHKEADLKNWKGNLKNSGFLPEERQWMTQLTTEGGVVDVYRRLKPETTDECYTWWSNRGQAYAKNVGWRLDYHLATPAFAVQSSDFSSPRDTSQHLVTKVEANAVKSLQVKRLKRMLDQRKINTEQFFSKIEQLVKQAD